MKDNDLTNLIHPIEILTVFERETADRCYTIAELSDMSGKACSTVRGILVELTGAGKIQKRKVKNRATARIYSVYFLPENEEEVLKLLRR